MSKTEGKNLVIVESPGKIKKLEEALGKDKYIVKASIGHIRDLDESGLSIDIEDGFRPKYVIPSDKKKVVADLKAEAKKASMVWLASDADREEKPYPGIFSKRSTLSPKTQDASFSTR